LLARLDFTLARIAAAQNSETLGEAIADHIEGLGIQWFLVLAVDPYGLRAAALPVLFNIDPEFLLEHYRNDYYLVDPILRIARSQRDGFVWNDAINPRFLDPALRPVLELYERNGFRHGCSIPIWQRGRNGIVCFAAATPIAAELLEELTVLAEAALERGVELFQMLPQLRLPALSDRELEVVQRGALGLSSKEIGDELGLTKRTVDFHFKNATVKLKGKNRIHAIVRAYRYDYLRFFAGDGAEVHPMEMDPATSRSEHFRCNEATSAGRSWHQTIDLLSPASVALASSASDSSGICEGPVLDTLLAGSQLEIIETVAIVGVPVRRRTIRAEGSSVETLPTVEQGNFVAVELRNRPDAEASGSRVRELHAVARHLSSAYGWFCHQLEELGHPPPLDDVDADILRWTSTGLSSEDIARVMGMSRKAVDAYLDRLKDKLMAGNRVGAVVLAIKRGLIRL